MPTKPLTQEQLALTRAVLDRCGWNITQAATQLGINRSTLQHRIKLIGASSKSKFEAPLLPSALPTIDELLERRIAQGDRSLKADDARSLIEIKVNIDGPIFGLWVWGDPHVDDDGCNIRLLKEHVELSKHPAILSGHIGDIGNFWVGRLARLYAHQSTSVHEAIMLAEWLLCQHENLFCVLGNHDCWNGSGLENPLNWMMRHSAGVTEAHGVRLALKQPCGTVTRVHARHDFSGRSQYNPNHGMRRELAFGHRDHILVAGHLHTGSDQSICNDGDGMVSQLVRVSGYKQVDHYSKQLGFPPAKIHPSALIIIDAREPETSRGRAWVAPTVEQGVVMLDALIAEWKREKSSRMEVRADTSSTPSRKVRKKSRKAP